MNQETTLKAAKSLEENFSKANLQFTQNISAFYSLKSEQDIADEIETKDPAIVAADVAEQIAFLRKLKFQYLEQNAKDKYVKSIVSDIDDAPIVSAEDNNELKVVNDAKKERLKTAKVNLAEVQQNIRTLTPLVETEYKTVKAATERAVLLAQKIIDARLSLTRFRQTHPQPRLTVPLADAKLLDQVTEMQTLSDDIQAATNKLQTVKDQVKRSALEMETLRSQRAEVEKIVEVSRVEEDDGRLVPLYDWYTASLALHRSVCGLEESHSASENELRLTYNIPSTLPERHKITITLIFAPDTRCLAAAQVSGLDHLGIDIGELIDGCIQLNDVHGLVGGVLARARAGV